MKRFSSRRYLRKTVIGLFAILGLAGMPREAPAFQFNNGDLVLAIYSTNGQASTEFYYDVGQFSTLLAPGTTTTVDFGTAPGSPFAPGSGVPVGGADTRFTLLGRNQIAASPSVNGIFTFTSSTSDAAGQTTASISPTNSKIVGWNSALLASTGSTPFGQGASTFLSSTDPAAFTNGNNFGIGGSLGGTWSGGMEGTIGSLLNIIQGQARNAQGTTNILSDVGRVVLSAQGVLSICGGAGCNPTAPVPVPAAVILFGSGLIGLVGIARRRISGAPV